MAAEPALAIVVRGTDWSETSRITTLFTREFGKVRALAKGGRRLRSNFEVAFDLLTVCNVVFLRKGHAGLDLDRKSTRLNSSHLVISYAVFCLKKKKI